MNDEGWLILGVLGVLLMLYIDGWFRDEAEKERRERWRDKR